jgi:hypothetical protein
MAASTGAVTCLLRSAARALAPSVLVAFLGCATSTDPYQDLGVRQVRVVSTSLPASLAANDTLVAMLVGRPDTGDCFTFSHADVVDGADQVTLTLWAVARLWQGSGPPPPCGLVHYRYVRPPPLGSGWFRILANQPSGSQRVDSVRVLP